MCSACWKINKPTILLHCRPHVAVLRRLFPTKLMCVMLRRERCRNASTESLRRTFIEISLLGCERETNGESVKFCFRKTELYWSTAVQSRHGGIDTFASATPQCSVAADLTCLCKRGSFHISHCTLCSYSTPALLSCRQSAAQSAAVRETHVLLTTDAITCHCRVKAGAQTGAILFP